MNNINERGSGDTEPRFLIIGKIGKPHGVRGEVRVIPYTEDATRFRQLETVFVGERTLKETAVESARLHKNFVLLKFADIDDRDEAERLRGKLLQVPMEQAIPLEEGEYFLFEIEDMAVYSDQEEYLGQIVDVIETQANNVFVVRGDEGELLLPDTDEVVVAIDFEAHRMTVHLLDGLR